MHSSSDAAESIIRMSLQGLEVAVKISGSGAKHAAALMYAIMKEKRNTSGKVKLATMMRNSRESKIFSVKEKDLKVFQEQAKKYGVLFCALVDKKNKSKDGSVDIIVRSEDASRVNRIITKFELATIDVATIKSEIEKTKSENNKGYEVLSYEDKLVNEIYKEPIKKEVNEQVPQLQKTDKKDPLKDSLTTTKKQEGTSKLNQKPSVKETINYYKQKIKEDASKGSKDNVISRKKSSRKKDKVR